MRRASTTALFCGMAFVFAAPAYAQSDEGADDIVVTGNSTAATKTDTPILSIPQSVSLVDRRRLDDRASRTLNEALAYTPGVNTGTYGFDPRYDAFFIRGFQATYTGVFRDGLRQLNSPSGLWRNEPYGLENITIVRGPASVLYGASGAGGLVDVTSKRPTGELFAEVQALAGSYDRYQLNADVSTPIGDRAALRLTGVARDSNTSYPGFADDRYYIAPALRLDLGQDTRLTLLGEYMWSKTGGSAAFYNDANGVTDLPLADPRFNELVHKQWRAGYELEHRFDDLLYFHQNVRVQRVDVDLAYSYVTDPRPPVTRLGALLVEATDSFNIDNQMRANFETGPFTHRVLVGLDYNHVKYRTSEGYGAVPIADNALDRPPVALTARQQFSQTGIYIQDQIEAGPLGITAGVRNDWLAARTLTPGAAPVQREDSKVTGRVGASLNLGGGVAPYLNWSTSFEPNIGLLVDGTPARPTSARQFEGGVKWSPRAGILLSAAAFDIRQTDGVVFDAADGVNRQVQLDLRSRGLEFEASARPVRGLDLTAAYALTDMEIRRGAAGTVGNTLSATPKHMASFWADYAHQPSGLGLGAGVRWFGPSFGNDQNTIRNDDRTFIDAVVHYDLPWATGLRFQLNATNLLDSEPATCGSGFCYRDQGRTLLGSIRYRM